MAFPIAPPSLAAAQIPSGGASADAELRDRELRASAKAFEAVFIAQMLSHAGLAKSLSSEGGFGGEAFSSMLVEKYAEKIVEQGGFGLAEHIYEQLKSREGQSAADARA